MIAVRRIASACFELSRNPDVRILSASILSLLCLGLFSSFANAEDTKPADELVIVVMDPLAKPLSCPCVAGYAQRDYEVLGAAMKKALGREVRVVFNESLVAAQKKDEIQRVDLVIGKQSVILHDAKASNLSVKKIAMLTGKDGMTTQRGLVVVATDDPAKKIGDLKGYSIYFGPKECDEKHAAAMKLMKKDGVEIPAKFDTAVACDEGAIRILEMAEKGERGCAVISSYAKPLLEGCGQVPKGAIRVVGETEEVPFIAAYINSSLDESSQKLITDALLKTTATDVALRVALETKRGFVGVEEIEAELAKKK
jgi:ABC-type phosphate/phosphonate transport system substrate-binding protein